MARWSPRTSASHSSGERPHAVERLQVEAGRPALGGLEQRARPRRAWRRPRVALPRAVQAQQRARPRRGRRRVPAKRSSSSSPRALQPPERQRRRRCASRRRAARPPGGCRARARRAPTPRRFCTSWASSRTSTKGRARRRPPPRSPGRTRWTSGGCAAAAARGSRDRRRVPGPVRPPGQRSSTRGSLSLPSSRSQVAGRVGARTTA